MRFNLPFLGVVGNNSAMNQIRCGQIMKYGEERGDVGNRLGDVPFDKFAQILGGYGEEVREPGQIRPALERAREAVASGGTPALINIWVESMDVWAPGTRKPDDVQVVHAATSSAAFDFTQQPVGRGGASSNGRQRRQGTRGLPHPRHDSRPDGSDQRPSSWRGSEPT